MTDYTIHNVHRIHVTSEFVTTTPMCGPYHHLALTIETDVETHDISFYSRAETPPEIITEGGSPMMFRDRLPQLREALKVLAVLAASPEMNGTLTEQDRQALAQAPDAILKIHEAPSHTPGIFCDRCQILLTLPSARWESMEVCGHCLSELERQRAAEAHYSATNASANNFSPKTETANAE